MSVSPDLMDEVIAGAATALRDVSTRKVPLHALVREELRRLVDRHFAEGDKFYTEPYLIERLGVSQGTVRRALSDLGREGLLIRKVPLGTFVRKSAANALTVQIFMPQCESPFLMAILEQVARLCRERAFPIQAHHTNRGESIAEALQQLKPTPTGQCVLLLGETPRAARALYSALSKRGFRVVNVDTLMPRCGDAYVGVDNEAGIRLGMNHLTRLGHRRIALLVNEPMEAGNTRARVNAFEAFVREAGLSEARVVRCGTRMGEDAALGVPARMERLMGLKPRPTAVFAVSDVGAWASLRWLNERGISVPEDVSVLGFDDDRASEFMSPPLSSLAQPIEMIAKRALNLLTETELRGQMEMLAPVLMERQSTGPAAGE